jgi:CAAX protease family protein
MYSASRDSCALSPHLDAMGIVNQPIENTIGHRRVTDLFQRALNDNPNQGGTGARDGRPNTVCLKPILVFVATAYALSITLSLVVGLTGGHESALTGLAYLSMFLPAVSVVIVSTTMNEPPRVRWDRFPLRYLPVALFLIPGVQHAWMSPFMASAPGGVPWQDWLTPQTDGLYHTPASRGWGAVTIRGLVGYIVLNAVVGLASNSFMAFFEEIGWRAWLLPRLWDRIGPRRAVVATAIIWGFWHVPFQLSGIQHIDGVSPMRLAFTLPFGIMIAGLIIGWLWLRTESIWIAAIAHGALNNWGQYAFQVHEGLGHTRGCEFGPGGASCEWCRAACRGRCLALVLRPIATRSGRTRGMKPAAG